MTEPRSNIADAAQKVVQLVLDEQVVVSGVMPIANEIWAIYGSIPVDGEVIVAEFDNRSDATTVLERIAAAERDLAEPTR